MADFVIAIGEIFGTKKDKKIEWFLVPELNKVLLTRGQFFRMNSPKKLSFFGKSTSLWILLNIHTRQSRLPYSQ